MKRSTFLFLSMIVVGAKAQTPTTFHFSVPEGLPSSEIYEVFEDKKGFLWFATDNGVATYDGSHFQTYHVKDGLTDPVVFGFFEDEQNRIWFRTFSGRLCYFDGTKIKTYEYNEQLIKNGEYALTNFVYDSRRHELWFAAGHTFGKIDPQGKVQAFETYRPYFFVQSVKGHLLQSAGKRYSIKNIFINNQKFSIQLTDTADFRFFNSLAIRDKIYVSIYKDVFEYQGSSVKKIFTSQHPIISLSKDRTNNLWLGYLNNGVERINDHSHSPNLGFLKNKSVTKVFEDRVSGFWFTTLESGAYYVPNFSIENFPLPTGSRLKTVLDLRDTVLMGDQGGNLYFVDGKTKKVLKKKTYNHGVYALFRDNDQNIWVSAGIDIVRHNPKFMIAGVYHRMIATAFFQDPAGFIWTLEGTRISQFNTEGRLIKHLTRGFIYRTMYVDDSVIYLGGRTGLHLVNREMQLLSAPNSFSGMKITQIESLNDTTLLFVTQGNGFFLFNKKNGRYRKYDTRHRFIGNNIYCLAKTDSTLWMGTEKGLVAIDIGKLLLDEMKSFNLTRRTGLLSDKINFILPVGETLWIFADEGFSVVKKSHAKPPDDEPTFYLKRLAAGKDTLTTFQATLTNKLVLPYERNHFSISFGYILFSNQGIFLRHRLSSGVDWAFTRETELEFSSLAPGDYSLELQFSHDNIHWIPAFQPIPFTIDAPWWRKWYTQAGGLAFMILLGYLYLRHRQSIYKQKAHYLGIINRHQQKLIQSEIETLERERKRIARELHDGVGTNLTAIKLMVNQLLKQHHEPRARDIEEQFQVAIKELKDIIYGLTPPSLRRYGLFAALRNYTTKLNDTLTPRISLQVFGKEIDNYEFNIMVFRIVQELISNSIKHSSAQHITIHLNAFAEMFNIVYEDDGVGFSQEGLQEGLGLDNIESRIQSINGTIKFDSGDHGVSYTIDIPLQSIREPV